jgi:hypothetical protein
MQLGFRRSSQKAFDFFHHTECIIRKKRCPSTARDAGALRTAPQRCGIKNHLRQSQLKEILLNFFGRPRYSAHRFSLSADVIRFSRLFHLK